MRKQTKRKMNHETKPQFAVEVPLTKALLREILWHWNIDATVRELELGPIDEELSNTIANACLQAMKIGLATVKSTYKDPEGDA